VQQAALRQCAREPVEHPVLEVHQHTAEYSSARSSLTCPLRRASSVLTSSSMRSSLTKPGVSMGVYFGRSVAPVSSDRYRDYLDNHDNRDNLADHTGSLHMTRLRFSHSPPLATIASALLPTALLAAISRRRTSPVDAKEMSYAWTSLGVVSRVRAS
jgi:hypothetical protein